MRLARDPLARGTSVNNMADGDEASGWRAPTWARPHVVFLLVAYAFSWTLWIVGWIVADVTDAGDLLFNQDFVWRVGFVRDVATPLLVATGIAFPAVYGPMIGGIVASGARRYGLLARATAQVAGDRSDHLPDRFGEQSVHGGVLAPLAYWLVTSAKPACSTIRRWVVLRPHPRGIVQDAVGLGPALSGWPAGLSPTRAMPPGQDPQS